MLLLRYLTRIGIWFVGGSPSLRKEIPGAFQIFVSDLLQDLNTPLQFYFNPSLYSLAAILSWVTRLTASRLLGILPCNARESSQSLLAFFEVAMCAKIFNRRNMRFWLSCRGIIPTFAPRSNVRPEGGFAFPGQENSKLRLPFYPYSAHDGKLFNCSRSCFSVQDYDSNKEEVMHACMSDFLWWKWGVWRVA